MLKDNEYDLKRYMTSQNDKIFDWYIFKAFADNIFILVCMMEFVFNRKKTLLGKEKNNGHQHFLLFLLSFQAPHDLSSQKPNN